MTAFEIKWLMARKNYNDEKKDCHRIEVLDYPLKKLSSLALNISGKSSYSSTGASTPISIKAPLKLDQLSRAIQKLGPLSDEEFSDPLNIMDSNNYIDRKLEIESWDSRKPKILSKFTTNEKLSIVSSFLTSGERVVVKGKSLTPRRLELMNEFETKTTRRMVNLSQQDFKAHMSTLNSAVIEAWNSDNKVKALQVIVQCAQLLSDVSVAKFYPSKYVLVTDILDNFGQLVYDRISERLQATNGDVVSIIARETCKNWFYKIATIRELVPRFYVEVSLLKCYIFIGQSQNYHQIFHRLVRSIRGIVDPLVAIYARCYLCRTFYELRIHVSQNKFLYENMFDFFQSYDKLFHTVSCNNFVHESINFSHYLSLLSPAFEYITQVSLTNETNCVLETTLDNYELQSVKSTFILNTLINNFPANFISSKALFVLRLIETCHDGDFPKYLLLRSFGLGLIESKPENDVLRVILDRVWILVNNFKKLKEYLICAEVWSEYICHYFSNTEIDDLLGSVSEKVDKMPYFETFDLNLKTIFLNILKIIKISKVLSLKNYFLAVNSIKDPIIGYDVKKAIMCKLVNEDGLIIADQIVAHNLLAVSKDLHDSMTALSPEDEKKQISNLIANFISRIYYGRSHREHQLQFYVECRQYIFNFDSVFGQLIQAVCRLAAETCNHQERITSDVQSFLKACSTYCFITIPTIGCILSKLKLYLLVAEVSLMCQNYGHAESCLDSIFDILPQVPSSIKLENKTLHNDSFLIPFLRNLLSFLLIVPDNPEEVSLPFLKKFLKFLRDYDRWDKTNTARAILYLNILDLLSALSQEVYIYHIDKVRSNDQLYDSDDEFLREIDKLAGLIVEEILIEIKEFGSNEQFKKQAFLSFELFLRIVFHADLQDSNCSLVNLAAKLWQFCLKYQLNEKLQSLFAVTNGFFVPQKWGILQNLFSNISSTHTNNNVNTNDGINDNSNGYHNTNHNGNGDGNHNGNINHFHHPTDTLSGQVSGNNDFENGEIFCNLGNQFFESLVQLMKFLDEFKINFKESCNSILNHTK